MVLNMNQNRDISNNLINDLELNEIMDIVPSKVNTSIQPVYPVYEKYTTIVRYSTRTTNGATTIYTTPSGKDFYLTGFLMSYVKSSAADSTAFQMSATVDGVSYLIADSEAQTGTAIAETITMTFPQPIKIDRNTGITVGISTLAAGTASITGIIYGFVKNNRLNVS